MSDSEEERPAIVRDEDGQLALDMPPIEVPPLAPPVQSFDGSGPRLIITKIVNNNFKSYAGIKTLGPFHKSFTCIIGPNGSGKSNVIDSMLFVFGYRASKIRSKKISVLIHSSEEHPGIDSCSVEVHFHKILDNQNDEDDYEEVVGSHFTVSRTAFRDNSSYYEINSKRSTYKEVSTMLKEYGIDLDHNRFLILQGEVEQIALMKPKAATEHEDGLLEYLEDIIGSSRFKQPIAELYKRVEALNDYRQEKLNRVKVVEREKADLEDIRNEAVDYLKLCNDVVKKKNVLYQKYIVKCETQVTAAKEKKEGVDEKLAALNEELKAIKEKQKEKIKENKDFMKNYEALQKKYNEGKERFSELEREDAKMRDELKYVKSNGKKLTRQKVDESKKIEDLARVPEEANIRLEDLNGRLEKLQKVKVDEEENLKKANETAERDTQKLKQEKAKKEEALAAFQTEVNENKSELKLSQSELDNILSAFEAEKNRFESAKKQRENIDEKLKQRTQDVKNIKESLPKNEHSLKQINRDLQQIMEKEHVVNDELRGMRVKLEEYKSSFQASRSQNKVLDALMDLKRNGSMPGIFGRLGDLGAIDDTYDVAISTAAAGPLNNIVTDTIDTAQKCVQYLKKHGIGQATFIGLDKMERWRQRAQQKIETPERVHRLFDLVRCNDDRVITAFYFALRDTLVARDLEQATRISYGAKRFRVVTLQGQLIETSGAMTGGGNTVIKGRMGNQLKETVDPEVMKNLEKSWESKNAEWQRLKQNRMRLEETAVRLNREVTVGRQSLDQYSMELDRLNADNAAVEKSIKSAGMKLKEVKPDEREVEKRKKTIASMQKAYESVLSKASNLKKDVDSLHSKIVDIIGEKVGTVQSRLDLVTADIDSLRKQMTKVRVSVKTAERNLTRAREKVESLEKEIEEAHQRIETVTAKLQELEKEADRVIGEFRSAQKEVKELEDVVASQKKEIEKIEAEEVEKKKVEVNITHERDQVVAVIDENVKRIRYWNKEISKLKLYYIEDEDNDETAEEDGDTSAVRERKTKLPRYTSEDLEEMSVEQVDITSLEDQLKALKPNMAAIEEYRRKEELYLLRVSELERVTVLRDEQRKQRENYKKNRLDEFMTGFHMITSKLKEMYQMITLGGDAELELVDSLDPFAEGIVFSVRPPKKSWKNISNLSGGEKTLSSLALVFALHHYKPTPLYVMDEIDAALDFKNVSIVAKYIQTRTKNAQFVIISLRSNMFEMADRLVGIYKTFNCTNSITINPRRFQLTTAIPLAATGLPTSAVPPSATAVPVSTTAVPLSTTPVSLSTTPVPPSNTEPQREQS